MLAFLDIRICTSVWQSQVPETAAKHKHMKKKKKKKKKEQLYRISMMAFLDIHIRTSVCVREKERNITICSAGSGRR
jgi:hypothetical protein